MRRGTTLSRRACRPQVPRELLLLLQLPAVPGLLRLPAGVART